MSNVIIVDKMEQGIAVIRLNRPYALNAFTLDMIAAFQDALRRLDGDATTRVIILAAEGRGFCAGLDLKSLDLEPGGADAGPAPMLALQRLFGSTPELMHRTGKPIIAAIGGVAVGMGFALALACDIRVADPQARFMIGAVKIGLSAGETGISYHLPRIIGAGRAFEVMLTGRTIAAEEASSIGLVSRLAAPGNALEAAVDIAREILANSPYSVAQTKEVMWRNLDAPDLGAAIQLENHVQVIGLLTDDFTEATRAFAQKRPPVFRGT